MQLIGTFRNAGYEALADGVMAFFDRRPDLQRRGVAFAAQADDQPQASPAHSASPSPSPSPIPSPSPALDKVSTDISLVAIDRSDPEAFALADVIMRGVGAGLERWLQQRPLFRACCPGQALFVNPIFNLQRYAPGEGFRSWHCDWTFAAASADGRGGEATEPIRRVLAWILYCNDLPDGGTEFHWQEHHEPAERGKLAIFPAGLSHIHRGRVSHTHTKTIATGWINAGSLDGYLKRLAQD
jgi:hypothetical protein